MAGVLVFFWLLATLPLRTAGVVHPASRRRHPVLRRLFGIVDSTRLQIALLLAMWGLQMLLHFSGLLPWVPAAELAAAELAL